MAKAGAKACARRVPWALVACAAALLLVGAAAAAGAAYVGLRRAERESGANAVVGPVLPAAQKTGAFTATIDYAALFSAEGHSVKSQVAWDDAWFFQDATTYNHDLAHTCAVLCAVANAESAYYQRGSGVPAYAEEAFAQLGFDEVSTESYRYRSEVADELAGIFDNQTDVVAYTLATKKIQDANGNKRLLTVVVVRGSYGSEWMSNLRLASGLPQSGEKTALAADDLDHLGFSDAAEEVLGELRRRAQTEEPDLERCYLVCGHSRGGAVTDLVAAALDDAAGTGRELAPAANVYAYGFAVPGVTAQPGSREARYSNIFNVLNPSDLIPLLPPASWGYDRYGVDVWLPGADDPGFDGRWDAMAAAYADAMGTAPSCDPADRYVAARFAADLSARTQGADDLLHPVQLAQTVWTLLVDVDVNRLLASHYPNTYIAWLESTTASDLRLC